MHSQAPGRPQSSPSPAQMDDQTQMATRAYQMEMLESSLKRNTIVVVRQTSHSTIIRLT